MAKKVSKKKTKVNKYKRVKYQYTQEESLRNDEIRKARKFQRGSISKEERSDVNRSVPKK